MTAPKTRPLISGETPMTGEERVAYLVKLAMEAYDAGPEETEVFRDAFRRAVSERMRQAAQVWGAEVDCAGDSK